MEFFIATILLIAIGVLLYTRCNRYCNYCGARTRRVHDGYYSTWTGRHTHILQCSVCKKKVVYYTGY